MKCPFCNNDFAMSYGNQWFFCKHPNVSIEFRQHPSVSTELLQNSAMHIWTKFYAMIDNKYTEITIHYQLKKTILKQGVKWSDASPIVVLNRILNISPDNFHDYVNRLWNLRAFS